MIKIGKIVEKEMHMSEKQLPDEQPLIFNIRVKRNSDDETLEAATAKGNYAYWLSQEDIADIARLRYNNYKRIGVSSEFEVLGSKAQLNARIEEFKLKTQHLAVARLTLIINLANLHWVTLMISYQNENYVGYYIDSKDIPISDDYYRLLLDQFQIQPISLRTDFPQQMDEYNCGLLALENAASLNAMLDENQSLHQVVSELKRPRSREYFEHTRLYLSTRLRVDPERNMRWSHRMDSVQSGHVASDSESIPKRQRVSQTKEEKTAMLLETFVEAFMSAFMKRLAAYHLASKGERLTDTTLKMELKTGLTGGLLGVSISQSIVGSIPSLVASLRMLSAKYYFPKAAAQKITRIFSTVLSGELSPILAEAAVNIFRNFESQFVQITDKAGDKVAMEKMAEDAVGRVLNYLIRDWDNQPVSKALIEKGLLLGSSEKFFDPSFKKVRIRISGNIVQDKNGNRLNTANLYAKVGVIVRGGEGRKKFYRVKDRSQSNQYGYRQLFSWEKEGDGELKQAIKDHYIEEQPTQEETAFQLSSRNHEYSLGTGTQHQEAQAILTKIESRGGKEPSSRIRQIIKKDSIFFDLRNPVANFVGRTEVLHALHQTLLAGRTTAITTGLASLSLHSSLGTRFPQSGSQTSVSGLGGIGKTQLVLRYAQLHAADYDNNVLWINAETKENLAYSLNTLATKLQIETKDSYSHEKTPEEIAEEIYDYFSDRKSLFIFDNVENYREIEAYLPKPIPGNKPSILITSRYSHWQNVASIIALGVFSEAESMALVKKELNLMDNTQDVKINELARLLQGLPLALQQALAYIHLQKNVNAEFGLQNYIELYKEKTKQLLSFDFSIYTHDPYSKTVFTTWQITLDKIQTEQAVGKNAIEILNVMAYLCPDNISNALFLEIGSVELSSALQLLKNYSMISAGSQQDKSSVHRLVQQVVRINLERDPTVLREVIRKTEKLIIDYEGNVENRFHYLHFLLYMTEYTEINSALQIGHASRELFRILPYHDTKYWLYFLDLAYINFSKERYIKFLGEALIYYSRSSSPLFLSQTLFYIEKKWADGVLSKENIKYILEYRYYPNLPYSKLLNLPATSQKREQQRVIIELIYSLKEKLFKSNKEYILCSAQPSRKRSVNSCRLSETERSHAEESDRQAIKTHLRNVARLSDWASSGLLTKDILSALVQGKFGAVAIDFSLISSSILLGKISNKLLTQGSLLVDKSLAFTKDLALENEPALKILLDKEVLLAAKSRFLGQAMKTVSPFVARGTVILFAYNLINEIEEYAGGDKELLPEIISNGVIVSIEGIQAGIEAAEFLGLIAGLSEFTGPIGMGAVALVWFGAEAYHAKKQLEAIETEVHLTLIEKLKQSLRAFFHLSPSEYLETKAANNQLVKNALAFLKKHTEIKRYIFPSFATSTALFNKSEVFLEKKRKLIVDDNMPDASFEGNLFCLSGDASDSITHWLESETSTYLCKHAIGLEYLVNRTGNITFSNLKQGDDEMLASSEPTLFLVEEGKKTYRGGIGGNLFILQGDSITGLLQGSNGTDTLLLNDFDPKGDYVLHDSWGFLCGKNNSRSFTQLACQIEASLELKDIEQIYGRKDRKDVFYISQYTDFIDGYGGKDKAYPDYFYITSYSHRNPKLVLRNNSVVLILLNTNVNSVSYRIPAAEEGEAKVQFSFVEAVQHQFFFDFALTDIRTITIENATIRFELASQTATNSFQEPFCLTISNPYFNLSEGQANEVEVPAQAYYFFQGIEVKLLNQDHIYAREYENKDRRTIDERINSFAKLAKHLGKAFFIQLMDSKSIFIGQKKHEIFYTNGETENYLIGNVIGNDTDSEDENIYVISAANAVFPLPNVTIYNNIQENLDDFEILTDTLDLRKVVERSDQVWPGHIVSSRISQIGNDLTLTLFVNTYRLVQITLRNALLDNWYQKLNVILDSSPRSIIRATNRSWQLETIPLTFDSDKEIIMLNLQNIDNNPDIFVLKKIGNYLFFRDKNNLIITNLFSNPYDRCTIICKQFYDSQAMREKLLAVTFTFFDQSLQLQPHLAEINNATNFSELDQRNITDLPLDWLEVGSNHSARRRSIRNALPKLQAKQSAEQMTSSATIPLSPIQGLLSWVKEKGSTLSSTISHFYTDFFSKDNYFMSKGDEILNEKENSSSSQHLIQKPDAKLFLSEVSPALTSQQKSNGTFNQNLLTNVTAQFELNGTLMLSQLIVQSLFNKKAANTQKFAKPRGVKSTLFKSSKIVQNEPCYAANVSDLMALPD